MHTKFQGHRLFGSREEDFLRFSWSCDQEDLSKLSFSHPVEVPYEIWLIGPVVSGVKMFKECRRRTTDDGAYLSYKLTKSPFGSGELNLRVPVFFILVPHIKFQDPISNRSWTYAKRNRRTHARTDARTDAEVQTNMPLNFFEVGCIKTMKTYLPAMTQPEQR